MQGKAPKEIHAFLTEIAGNVARFLPGRAKDLSALLYFVSGQRKFYICSCDINSFEKRSTTARNYHTTLLSISTLLLCLLVLLPSERKKALSYVICERVNLPLGPTFSVFVTNLLRE
jgi:hypothetical protein